MTKNQHLVQNCRNHTVFGFLFDINILLFNKFNANTFWDWQKQFGGIDYHPNGTDGKRIGIGYGTWPYPAGATPTFTAAEMCLKDNYLQIMQKDPKGSGNVGWFSYGHNGLGHVDFTTDNGAWGFATEGVLG